MRNSKPKQARKGSAYKITLGKALKAFGITNIRQISPLYVGICKEITTTI